MAKAKEVRHAGIGLDLSINGLDDFKRANSMMDDFLDTMKEASRITDKFKSNFSDFGGDTSREVNKARDSIKETIEGMGYFNKATIRTTDAIHQQNVEMQRMKDSVKSTSAEMQRMPKHVLSEINQSTDKVTKSTNKGSDAIKKYSDHVDKAHDRVKRLHDIIFGSFVGTAVSNGIQAIGSGLWQSAKNGFELAEAGERIQSQWKTIGITSKQTEELGDQIGDIRSKADMSGGAINDMQKKIYSLTNSVSVTKTLTNEMAAYGSEAGKTGEQIQQMTGMVAKSLGSKTVSAGFFNRVFGQMPALRKRIQEASGMTNSAFNKALQNSKISGTQMQSWMVKAAKGSESAFHDYQFQVNHDHRLALLKLA